MRNTDAPMNNGKLVIISAPSGAGKTTIVKHLLKTFTGLEFSISATSRPPRHNEKNGVDYYFISADEFSRSVKDGDFIEWEEVYTGTYYGTLRSEMDRIWSKGNTIVFDVDVKGGLRLKDVFGSSALSIFIMPPSIEELRHRLVMRRTDTPEIIEKRVGKAMEELAGADRFDRIVINDSLADAIVKVEHAIRDFIGSK